LPVRPFRPFGVFEQYGHGVALVRVTTTQAVRVVRAHGEQDRVTQSSLADFGGDFIQARQDTAVEPMVSVSRPVILPVMEDDQGRKYDSAAIEFRILLDG